MTKFVPVAHATEECEERTLLRVTIFTGVTHQIRAQLAMAGMHIVNDRLYGAFAVEGLSAREKPWLLGNAEEDDAVASGENLLYLRGCMNGRKWTSRSIWPDPHMSLFLDKLRDLCSQLCGE